MENQQKLCDTCGYKDRRDARSYKARLYVIMQCNRWFGVTPLQQSNFREEIPNIFSHVNGINTIYSANQEKISET